jgi:hypothetical protein
LLPLPPRKELYHERQDARQGWERYVGRLVAEVWPEAESPYPRMIDLARRLCPAIHRGISFKFPATENYHGREDSSRVGLRPDLEMPLLGQD